MSRPHPDREPVSLAPQQYGCVELVARAMPDKEIARELGIAVGTVKVHMQRARHNTGARNRVELALMFARGEIQPMGDA